jgi:hypothetical protein
MAKLSARSSASKHSRRPLAQIGNDGQRIGARLPLLKLCRQHGWAARHLSKPAESHDKLVELVIQELMACRREGHLDLTVALADEAMRRGIDHQRIAANRLRALKGLQSPDIPGNNAPDSRAKTPMAKVKVRKKPFLDLCRSMGWDAQFLIQPAGTPQELVSLLIKELMASREAGEFNLTVALADRATSLGLNHPRISAIRSRALRARQKGSALTVVPNGALVKRAIASLQQTPKGFWGKLRQAAGISPHPREAPRQLVALLAVCTNANWSARFLCPDALNDLAKACGQEMRRCRQANRHDLVVSLGTEAAVQGLEGKQILEHLNYSRRQAQRDNVIQQVDCLLTNNPPAADDATTLLVNALATEPGYPEYRSLLAKCVRQVISQRTETALSAELLEATVQLEVNERVLEALQRRQSG